MSNQISRRVVVQGLGMAGFAAFGAMAPAFAAVRDEVIENARKEGALLWYDHYGRSHGEQILKKFQNDYPFVKDINYVEVPAAQKQARIVQECLAGGPTTDVFLNTAATLEQLAKQSFLQDTDWKGLGLQVSDINTPNPQMSLVTSVVHVAVYNADKVKGENIPKTWDDMVADRWKGRIGAWSRAAAYIDLASAWGEEKIREHVKRLAALEPRLYAGTFPLAQAIAAGEVDLGLGTYDATLRVIARGAPIAIKALDPVPVAPLYGCVIKQGKNPNAARLLLSWLGTKAGALTYEEATNRGNFLIPETKAAQFLKGVNVTYFTAKQSIEQEKSLNALERNLALVLKRR